MSPKGGGFPRSRFQQVGLSRQCSDAAVPLAEFLAAATRQRPLGSAAAVSPAQGGPGGCRAARLPEALAEPLGKGPPFLLLLGVGSSLPDTLGPRPLSGSPCPADCLCAV